MTCTQMYNNEYSNNTQHSGILMSLKSIQITQSDLAMFGDTSLHKMEKEKLPNKLEPLYTLSGD